MLAPAAAFSYSEGEYAAAVSTTNPDPGQSFTVAVQAPSGADVTLTASADGVSGDSIEIAGTKALTKAAIGGMAVFTVTLSEEALYRLAASDEDGNVIETFAINVGDPAATEGGASDAPGIDAAATRGSVGAPILPETGTSVEPLLAGGTAFLLIGSGLAFSMCRRYAGVS